MTSSNGQAPSRPQVAAAASAIKAAFLGIAFVSGVINLLTLTAPLFMLQVYDRVIPSQSIPTLLGFAALAVMLFGFQAALEILRERVLLRVAERLGHRLAPGVYAAVIADRIRARPGEDNLQPLRDLDNVRGFLGGPGVAALFDLPWIPLYLGLCFFLHFWIGVTALSGAVVLIGLTCLTAALTAEPARQVNRLAGQRNNGIEAARRNAEAIQAMGLEPRLLSRWRQLDGGYLRAQRRTGDIGGLLGGISRSLRVMLQSTILGVGAWLVIGQEATAGVMIASSIMMGRALMPVDRVIGSWKSLSIARQSWKRLKDRLDRPGENRAAGEALQLPAPCRELLVEALGIAAPGQRRMIVQGIGFRIPAGSALGIIGPSGSGKTSLVRALMAIWPATSGHVRLDGAKLDQWPRAMLGRHIGYLPQGVDLFEGTIAENIARFDPDARAEDVIAAAQAAGVHELILKFERGYETPVGEGGAALSAGQRQMIGLARALYGAPFLVVLDEPNANLDAEGEAAVTRAISSIRARGGIAVVIVHRPSAIGAVDLVLMMQEGRMKAFGPREEVLGQVLKKRTGAEKAAGPSLGSVSFMNPYAAASGPGAGNRAAKAGAEDAI